MAAKAAVKCSLIQSWFTGKDKPKPDLTSDPRKTPEEDLFVGANIEELETFGVGNSVAATASITHCKERGREPRLPTTNTTVAPSTPASTQPTPTV